MHTLPHKERQGGPIFIENLTQVIAQNEYVPEFYTECLARVIDLLD